MSIHLDGDMMVYTAHQLRLNPLKPPIGDYGIHMALHGSTLMPSQTVWFRNLHPPLLPLILAPFADVGIKYIWIFHLVFLIWYVLAIWAGWLLFGLFFSQKEQVLATWLWAFCPALMVNSHTLMWDVPVTALMVLSLVLAVQSRRNESLKQALFSGIFAGLAALTKSSAIILYGTIPLYYLFTRKWRMAIVWCIPALMLPLIWVIHNLALYGKIQYISTGQFNIIMQDVRYKFERNISYVGGALILPFIWFIIACRTKKSALKFSPFVLICMGWGFLLVYVLHNPWWYAVAYTVFASTGLWVLYQMIVVSFISKQKSAFYSDSLLCAGYVLSYMLLLNVFPAASVRYLLPIIPFCLFVFIEGVRLLNKKSQIWVWSAAIASSVILSILLSVGDYLFCEADRLLPKMLQSKGYTSEHTWYFGRMSFGYYMFHNNYQNLRLSDRKPNVGEFAVLNPSVASAGEGNLECHPVDTILLYRFPFKTIGNYAGFEGSSRIPYAIEFNSPMQGYIVYQYRKRS
jgi:hypothetical protein